MKNRLLPVLLMVLTMAACRAQEALVRWPEDKANAWCAQQPWLVGASFIASNAINQLETFQAATFDPALNDKELGMGESIGMNTMRFFLQDQLWAQPESDVISFHYYDRPQGFQARIKELQPLHRLLICTEYTAGDKGSTFDAVLPIAKQYYAAAINWGLVAGKTQTYLPWDSWQRPCVLAQPAIWFHEVFRQEDIAYRQREVDLIRELTGRGTPAAGVASPQ